MLNNIISSYSVIISFALLLISYIFIATEKIPKVTIALFMGAITIILGLVGQNKFIGEDINPLYFINYIDFNVIFLLVSMMIIVNICSKSKIFNRLAGELLRLTKGHPVKILFTLGLFTAVISAFLDNVTTVILILPITFSIAKKLEIDPFPFLLTEIFTSNIGGTATLIDDPPNIIIGSIGGLSFMDFIKELTPVILAILFTVLIILTFIFKNKLKANPDKMKQIEKLDNSSIITDKKLMLRSVIVLLCTIVGFMLHDIIHVETCIVAMFGASILLLFEKPSEILKEVEWNTIFFFIGLFIIIGGLEASGGINLMAKFILEITEGSKELASMLILWASGVISGIIDNIPYTATMAPMIEVMEKTMGKDCAAPLWWSLSLGACLGGNMTIIGAACNVIVSESAAKENCPISFMRFLKYGAGIVLISLIISSVYIYFRFLN